jgi:hypothetical protein
MTSSSTLVKWKWTLYQRQLLYFSLIHNQKPDPVIHVLHFNSKDTQLMTLKWLMLPQNYRKCIERRTLYIQTVWGYGV